MDDERIRKEIGIGFEYSYLHEDWVNPLDEALGGLTADQALWKSRPEGTSIWEMVLHMATWNENIVERVQTGEKVESKDGPWPALPPEKTEEQWEQAKQRLRNSLDSIRTAIEQEPMDKLVNNAYGLGDLFCRFNHMAYHLGQITKQREFMGLD